MAFLKIWVWISLNCFQCLDSAVRVTAVLDYFCTSRGVYCSLLVINIDVDVYEL